MHEITNFVLILDFLSPNKLFCFSSVFDFVRLYRSKSVTKLGVEYGNRNANYPL